MEIPPVRLDVAVPRWRRVLGVKIAVWLGLAVGICVPYFTLQRVVLFPVRTIPATPLDAMIDFDPRWVWAYASLALLVPLAPLLATDRADLRRYSVGLALLCSACFVVFLFFPVLGPRPVAAVSGEGLYAFIVGLDRPSNSLPSLHAGLAVYSGLFAWRVIRAGLTASARTGVATIGVVWIALILYSTLATAQHWVLDLVPGMALAALAHGWAWRSARDGEASST